MQIKSFQPHNAEGVKSLIASIMADEYSAEAKAYQYGDLEDIKNAYGKIREKFLVVEEGPDVIGTAGIKEDSETTALLRRLFVHHSHRGRGVASIMVDTAIDFCKMNHYKVLVFRATSTMQAAIKLLTDKKGFKEKERYVFDNMEIVMLHYKIH